MFGERDEPYKVLSGLGRRLELVETPQALLPTLVETIAQTLKLPFAAVELREAGQFVPVSSYGLALGEPVRLPLVYQGEVVGQLVLAPRRPTEPFTPGEMRLLQDIAHQAGIAAKAVQLNTDLQHSREALILAREEERRRLRRDLHDGLGPGLASLNFKLEAARYQLHSQPFQSEALLNEAKGQVQQVIAEIRHLAYALRPPALDELGLVGALHQQANGYGERGGLSVAVSTPDPLPALPAALEVAVYRIALEALVNVVRHAQANHCHIFLRFTDNLELEVSDDGVGLPETFTPGIGMSSMRERAEELGGTFTLMSSNKGTRLLATLPLSIQARGRRV
jgi:signal transduction histidine kinase